MAPASPGSMESEEDSEDVGPGGNWVVFPNPSTGVTLRLPAHNPADFHRWGGPGAWTCDIDALDKEARQCIAVIGRQPRPKKWRRWRREDSQVPCLRGPTPHDRPSSANVAGPPGHLQLVIFDSLTQSPPAPPQPRELNLLAQYPAAGLSPCSFPAIRLGASL